MAHPDLEIHETFSPSTAEIDFLTEKINDESRARNISSDAYPFGIFLRAKKGAMTGTSKTSASLSLTSSGQNVLDIVGGCNGSIVYGSIYTDQLWVHSEYRGKGFGKMLMEKVHELGKRKQCAFACVGTMDFQQAQEFYESLGYTKEFERLGYANGGKMIYLRKDI